MIERQLIPCLVFGLLVGWLAHSLFQPVVDISPGNLVSPIVTLIVGWSIQRTLRKQNELERIPLDSVARVCQRIEQLVTNCLEKVRSTSSSESQLLQDLRVLSNEVLWLGTLASAFLADDEQERTDPEYKKLESRYFSFKSQLTDSDTVDLAGASEIGRSIRSQCLVLQFGISRRVLIEPSDIEVFTARLSSVVTRPQSKRNKRRPSEKP